MSGYSAYLFDLDGTLYDRDVLVRRLITEQRKEFHSELANIAPHTYIERVVELDAHGYNPKEQLYAQIAVEWGLPPRLQSRLLEHFWDSYDSHCELPEDTLTTLRGLQDRGARLGIATNGRTDRQNRKIEALGIRDYFDAVLISEAEGLKKPNEQIFQRALSRCSATASESVFIGDHPIADIDGARGAGIDAIWKKVTYWEMKRKDVRVIEQLAEILS